jgi:hypothetical protein
MISGADGRISWSKIVTAVVLAMYAFDRPLPQGVAIAALAASFGVKVFTGWLTRNDDPPKMDPAL